MPRIAPASRETRSRIPGTRGGVIDVNTPYITIFRVVPNRS